MVFMVSNLQYKKAHRISQNLFTFTFFPQVIFLHISLKTCPVVLFLYSYSYRSLFFQTYSLLISFTLWVLRETESRYECLIKKHGLIKKPNWICFLTFTQLCFLWNNDKGNQSQADDCPKHGLINYCKRGDHGLKSPWFVAEAFWAFFVLGKTFFPNLSFIKLLKNDIMLFFSSYKCITIDILPERTWNPYILNTAQTPNLSQIIFTLLSYQVYLSFSFVDDLAPVLSGLITMCQSRQEVLFKT